ncbi:transporter substrate-binding domain-containing protein [Cyanobacterium stanieri LEGE 03274]|uniref:Transporter substrate-binding domain-containing protein n=1 Tax=Cyanobacterium stanieri LEGE 03274 TaxID=1828756 RepID=A0ABR9V1V2_9CHRO|nr:transporter substrate-binding domain-containing protein [Cyanobacterium stanieri]MBE9221091.1 transporter substrate-binding domain-containing protein [Cyanobacterium stanieri LEGE 03274]
MFVPTKINVLHFVKQNSWIKIIIFSVIIIFLKPVSAQENTNTLRVSTRPFPPFVFEDNNGKYSGFSIELWDEIANSMGVEYELYSEDNVEELLNSVVEGRADVSVAGISMTSEREQIIDFSHPFFDSGLNILVSGEPLSPLRMVINYIFVPSIWITVGILCLFTIFAAHIMWFFERKENDEMFPRRYLRGIWESFWWSVVTLVTVGYGDKTPTTAGGRIVATIWMFAGILLISYFTASISSSMTVDRLDTQIRGYNDLRGRSVGTVAGSTSVDFLNNLSANVVVFENIERAYEALKNDDIEAVVYDEPVLLYLMNRQENYNHSSKIIGNTFDTQSYAIVLPRGSSYRNEINRAILSLREDGTYDQIYERWFGSNNEF